jgi:hypothetical protein
VGLQVISLKKLGVDDIVHFDFMEPLEDSADSASQSPSQHSQRCCGVVGILGTWLIRLSSFFHIFPRKGAIFGGILQFWTHLSHIVSEYPMNIPLSLLNPPFLGTLALFFYLRAVQPCSSSCGAIGCGLIAV